MDLRTPSVVKVWDAIEVDVVVVEVLPTAGDVLEKGWMDVRGSLALVTKVGGGCSRVLGSVGDAGCWVSLLRSLKCVLMIVEISSMQLPGTTSHGSCEGFLSRVSFCSKSVAFALVIMSVTRCTSSAFSSPSLRDILLPGF